MSGFDKGDLRIVVTVDEDGRDGAVDYIAFLTVF